MSTQGLAFHGDFHVQNKIWTDVDAYTQTHAHPQTAANYQVLLDALRNSRDKGLPDIATAPVVAKMYALQCKAKGVQHALEIEAGARPRLGFAYIDADKENNWTYLDRVIPLCEPGAVVYVDNIVRGGRVLNADSQEQRTMGARRVVEMAGRDERIDSVVVQFVGEKGYDGMLMAVVR